MNLKELTFPIRIYWDLTPLPDDASINYRVLAEEIVAMKFFTLNLLDTGSQLSSPCIEILERLKNEMISVSLTVSESVVNAATIELLSELKVNELLVACVTVEDVQLISESVRQFKENNMTIGVSFQVNKENYRDIPAIVSFCANNDIVRLVFPMQRLLTKADCFYISREEGAALSRVLNEIKMDEMKITIHDPFLWRVFYPDVSFPGGGCQAANSMASIAPDGNVYPCPSMPLPLGNIRESSLKHVLMSDVKKELMKSIRQAPEECLECEDLSGCMGGCKGRTLVLSNSLILRDVACK